MKWVKVCIIIILSIVPFGLIVLGLLGFIKIRRIGDKE
jgi:uncharacterized BrkB/YihY/UPF0761 family membrane protein